MTETNTVEFKVYGSYVLLILKDAKLLRNDSLSGRRKMIGTCITSIFLSLSILIIISEVVGVKNSYDLITFTSYFNPICFHFCGTFKWIYAIMNVNKIEEVIEHMKRCHDIALKLHQSDKDNHYYRTKMMESNRISSKFALYYLVLLICGPLKWIVTPLLTYVYMCHYGKSDVPPRISRDLPYPGVFPWSMENIYKYSVGLAFQAIASVGSGLGHAIYELMNITLLIYVCGQIEYLNDVLTDRKDNEFILSGDFSTRKFKNKIRNCVRHHRQIMLFLEKLTQLSSTPLFIICSQSTIALCLVSLQVSTMQVHSTFESFMEVSAVFEYWLGIGIELFLYCYLSTKVQVLGLETADAIYACDWEQALELSPSNQENSHNEQSQMMPNINQMVQISLMRAQKPIIVNGGLFYILSLETYKALMGFALSNAIVLRQLSE